jgi:hypothetical protein
VCAKNPKCTIVVKVNVIYDRTVNNGKGLTDEQKKAFEKEQMAKAQKDYAKSNIKLEVPYTEGAFTVVDGNVNVTGQRSDALNVVVSNATISGFNESGVDKNTGNALTFININDVHNVNLWPLFTNTTDHEMAHQFSGDVYRKWDAFGYFLNEFVLDAHVAAQAAGMSQQTFRTGLESRRYAAPLNPEANKPQQ